MRSGCKAVCSNLFQNKITEATELLEDLEEKTGNKVEIILTPGKDNPAKLITRNRGIPEDIASAIWQQGSAYLHDSPDISPKLASKATQLLNTGKGLMTCIRLFSRIQ